MANCYELLEISLALLAFSLKQLAPYTFSVSFKMIAFRNTKEVENKRYLFYELE